jgi:hypothetical protein
MTSQKLYSERTSLRSIILALLALIIGIVLLLLSENRQQIKDISWLQAILRDLGALLVSTVTIATLWELAAKRAFLTELMSKAKLAEDIRSSGIVNLTDDFYGEIDWKKMFKSVKKMDIFFAYGHTWRGTNASELKDLAKRSDVRIRVVLPDFNNEQLMHELGKRFRKEPDEVKRLINEAADDFKGLFKDANFSLWLLPESPVFSFYRFDHLVVLALYKHGLGRGNVPTFIVEQGGKIYDFVRLEFEEFIGENGLARKIFPEPNLK